MKIKNLINKRAVLYNELFSHKKSNLKLEKDFNDNFPRINSKYFSTPFNPNLSKLANNNNLLTDRTYKNENKTNNNSKFTITPKLNKKNAENKLSINIKNLGIEEKKDFEFTQRIKFQTLNDLNIDNILRKKMKNKPKVLLNILKDKDSDMISTTKNIENNILENNSGIYMNKSIKKRNENISIDINNKTNDNKTNDDSKFKNIGTNTKLSKTTSYFNPQNNNNNKIIYSYKTKENNKNQKTKSKFLHSRNENYSNNYRQIFTSNGNETYYYKRNENINNKNIDDSKNKTVNNFKNNFKVNNLFLNLFSNDIFRKVELNDQANHKISDEYVQNLLNREIDEIDKAKKKKVIMNRNNDFRDELFQNSKIKNKFYTLKTENSVKINDNINNKPNQNQSKEEAKENNKENYIDKDMIISKLKKFDLRTNNDTLDNKLINIIDQLSKLESDNKNALLNDKDVRNELSQYFMSFLKSHEEKEKKNSNEKYQDKLIMTEIYDDKEIEVYNEEEKNIIKDIIYQLSNDLNENLEAYKMRRTNNIKENSINHVINSISLAQLFERLNNASSISGKKKKFKNKTIALTESNINNRNKINDMNSTRNKIKKIIQELFIKDKENINNNNNNIIYSNENDEDKIDNNIENEKIMDQILFNIIESKELNEEENDKILENILKNVTVEKRKTISKEIKQVLSEADNTEKEKNIMIKSKNFNSKSNKNIKKNYGYISKNKEIKTKKNKSKNKQPTEEQKTKEKNKNININNSYIIKSLDGKIEYGNNGQDYEYNSINENIITDNDINNDIQNNNDINNNTNKRKYNGKNNNSNNNNIYIIDTENMDESDQERYLNDLNNNINISKDNRKSIISPKNRNKLNNVNKNNKKVIFHTPEISEFNIDEQKPGKKLYKNSRYNENKIFSSISNNDSFIDNEKINQQNVNFDFSSMNMIKSLNINMENNDGFYDGKTDRKYSSNLDSRKKNLNISMIESLSKMKRKKFQKTKRSGNNHLISIKNEYTKNENKVTPVDIKEQILDRKLKNFFGKIKMLKNANASDYEEQLKMFIDNEIDKLNDWETKEQEIRINHFFSDLKLIKKKVTIGGELRYINPSKFSSTWNNFGKFMHI